MAGMMGRPQTWITLGGVSSITAAYFAIMGLSWRHLVDLSQPGSVWRLLAIVFALLNLKSLPFAWHIRLLYGVLRHVPPRPHRSGPSALFQPVIISSHSSLLECDYNIHKSNSTYFSDLDVGRLHLTACLMQLGMHRARAELNAQKKGSFNIMLGAVTCSFRREIRPYEPFEVWTRVLAWDRKWFYLVSHIVRKGAVRPKAYTLQPWRNETVGAGRKGEDEVEKKEDARGGEVKGVGVHPAIFATSLAKYVFKQGRMTVPPETVLLMSGLLPPKPKGEGEAPVEKEDRSTPALSELPNGTIGAVALEVPTVLPEEEVDASLEPESADGVWDWDRAERERARGMRAAEAMAGLEALHDVFTAEKGPALGQF